jgi:hypothetical protein
VSASLNYVYLDTVIWNLLCNSSINPQSLRSKLNGNGLEVVFSPHVFYELAKSFVGTRQVSRENAPLLLQRFRSFVVAGFPCIQQTPHLLRQEARVANNEQEAVSIFETRENRAFLLKEADKLSDGIFDEPADGFVSYRKRQVQAFRQESREKKYEDRKGLTALPLEQFIRRNWNRYSRQILKSHLNDVISATFESHLTWVAKRLLLSKSYRVSHAMVRSDLFLTQHRARTGSLARDLLDDCYHVVNAAYCDIYGTCESAQLKYVPIVLPQVKFALYKRNDNLIEWLYAL